LFMQEEQSEFFKLDTIDRKVLFWLMDNTPWSVDSWVDHIAGAYRKSGAVKIDSQKLLEEIMVAMNDVARRRSEKV